MPTIRLGAGLCLLALTACWRIGEPSESDAVVAWAAFPDTVGADEVFPFEFAGPITPDACGRLDSAVVAVTQSSIELSARRLTFDTMCPDSPVGFYEVRALSLPAGSYEVRAGTVVLGRIESIRDARFAPMRAAGTGTLRRAGGCILFGPGRIGGNQRPFALRGTDLNGDVGNAALDGLRLVEMRGTVSGFTVCGEFGSRPVIRVDELTVLDRSADDYYAD